MQIPMKEEETLRVTCVGYVEFPTRGAVRAARCPGTTVLSVACPISASFAFGAMADVQNNI
jgi:hypothetical protein